MIPELKSPCASNGLISSRIILALVTSVNLPSNPLPTSILIERSSRAIISKTPLSIFVRPMPQPLNTAIAKFSIGTPFKEGIVNITT